MSGEVYFFDNARSTIGRHWSRQDYIEASYIEASGVCDVAV